MAHPDDIQIDLIKLQNGERLLRLTDTPSGLVLEKKLDPEKALLAQKKRLSETFAAALVRHRLTVA
jgi:hypothetical protein